MLNRYPSHTEKSGLNVQGLNEENSAAVLGDITSQYFKANGSVTEADLTLVKLLMHVDLSLIPIIYS